MNLMFKTIRALNSSLILLNISLEHLTKTLSLFRTACKFKHELFSNYLWYLLNSFVSVAKQKWAKRTVMNNMCES